MTPDYTETSAYDSAPDAVRVYAAPGKVLLSVANVERLLDRREVSALVDALCEAAAVSDR